MKLSLKAVNGKLRFLAQRVGQGLKHVLDCCCETPEDTVFIFKECCDETPGFAISKAAYDQLTANGCFTRETSGRPNLLRRTGSNICYKDASDILNPLTKSQAIAAGYEIIDDIANLVCVNPTSNSSLRCFAEEQDCRECPTQCCIVTLFRKNCPDVTITETLPKANICCNLGRQARRVYRESLRYQETEYTYLNGSEFPDPWCPITGCLQELFLRTYSTQTNLEDVSIYTRCPTGTTGTSAECVTRNYYEKSDGVSRRWAFREPRTTDTNCLQYEDVPFNEEYRNNDCGPAGNIYGNFPPRIRRSPRPRPECDVYNWIDGNPICQDIDNTCTYVDLQNGMTTKTRTVFEYEVGCFQGSARYRVEYEVRTNNGFASPCLPNKFLFKSTLERTWSYSILTTRRDNCPSNACSGYEQTGLIASSFEGPQPIQGALNLL